MIAWCARPVSDSVDRSATRADTVGSWWTPGRWVLLTATLVYLLGVLFRLPCRITEAGQSPDSFRWMCYSDIGMLYQLRGLMQGNVPYLDSGNYPVLEYPVLTGWFLELERLISTALGAPTGSELTAQQQVDSTLIFTDVNIVLLGALLLVTVWAQVGTVPHRPWDAMMLAASPCVAATALINWDLLAGRADRRWACSSGPAVVPAGPVCSGGWGWRRSSIRCSCSDRCCCSVCGPAGCGSSAGCWRRSRLRGW